MAIVVSPFYLSFCRYIKWMQQNYPTDSRACSLVIERCLQKFADSPLYLQDMRFLHIWITYISSLDFQNAKDTFSFTRSRGIGTKHALFYLAETIVYEQNCDYEHTERIYQEGITQ